MKNETRLQFIPRVRIISFYEYDKNLLYVGLQNFVVLSPELELREVLPIAKNRRIFPKLVKPIMREATKGFYQSLTKLGNGSNG